MKYYSIIVIDRIEDGVISASYPSIPHFEFNPKMSKFDGDLIEGGYYAYDTSTSKYIYLQKETEAQKNKIQNLQSKFFGGNK